MPDIGRWEGVTKEGPWTIEASYDCFTEGEPFVVDVWINFDDRDSEAGAFLSPEQAREFAAHLLKQADYCEQANARRNAS